MIITCAIYPKEQSEGGEYERVLSAIE